jgi:hypothetical protein
MRTFKFTLLCLFTVSIFTNIYSNSFSEEANFILRNKVNISRLDSLYYVNYHHIDDRSVVAKTLMKYKSEDAIALFNKLLKDERLEYQNYSIFPLINVGKFNIAFKKYKELVINNNINIQLNFYNDGNDSDFSKNKLELYKQHKNEFSPFLKKVCSNDTISNSIKLRAANILYILGEKNELKLVCEMILENIPEITKNWKEHSQEEKYKARLRLEAQKLLNIHIFNK